VSNQSNRLQPLAEAWRIETNAQTLTNLRLSASDKKRLQEDVAGDSLDGLAFALDQAVNNTNLVTLFVYGGQHLLFPGDAQYGNWKMGRLKQQTKNRIPRSDSLSIRGRPNAPKGPPVSKMPKGFRKGDFWYDYLIRL